MKYYFVSYFFSKNEEGSSGYGSTFVSTHIFYPRDAERKIGEKFKLNGIVILSFNEITKQAFEHETPSEIERGKD